MAHATLTGANLVRFTILNVSPCSDQHTRSSETGDETISYSLSRKGATLSTSSAPVLSSEKTPIQTLPWLLASFADS